MSINLIDYPKPDKSEIIFCLGHRPWKQALVRRPGLGYVVGGLEVVSLHASDEVGEARGGEGQTASTSGFLKSRAPVAPGIWRPRRSSRRPCRCDWTSATLARSWPLHLFPDQVPREILGQGMLPDPVVPPAVFSDFIGGRAISRPPETDARSWHKLWLQKVTARRRNIMIISSAATPVDSLDAIGRASFRPSGRGCGSDAERLRERPALPFLPGPSG
jgi:hypothetical protein